MFGIEQTCSQPGPEALKVGAELGLCSSQLLGRNLSAVGTVDSVHQVVCLIHHHNTALQMQAQGVPAVLCAQEDLLMMFLMYIVRVCMAGMLYAVLPSVMQDLVALQGLQMWFTCCKHKMGMQSICLLLLIRKKQSFGI